MIPFRLAVWIFVVVLVADAVWLLSAELIRPDLPYFPNAQLAAAAAAQRTRASRAAAIGFVRGDLWTEDAIALAAPMLANLPATPTAAEDVTIPAAAWRPSGRRSCLRTTRARGSFWRPPVPSSGSGTATLPVPSKRHTSQDPAKQR